MTRSLLAHLMPSRGERGDGRGRARAASGSDGLLALAGLGSTTSAALRQPRASLPLVDTALVGVVLIAEGLAGRVRGLLVAQHIPPEIGGVLIAALVLAPEGFAALRSAARGEAQRSVNILLGSALSTIGLTVHAVIAIRFLTGNSPELGLEPPYIVLLFTTFLVSAINLNRGKLNAMSGAVHIMLFLAWIVTILDEAAVRN